MSEPDLANDEQPTPAIPVALSDPDMSSFTGDWPTHGGYLGCLMGMFVGCILAGFLGSTLIAFVHFAISAARPGFIIAAVVVVVFLITLFGRLGWGAGKRIYREYPTPQRQPKSVQSE